MVLSDIVAIISVVFVAIGFLARESPGFVIRLLLADQNVDVAAFCPLIKDIGTLCIVLTMIVGVVFVRLREDWQRFKMPCVCILIYVLRLWYVGHLTIDGNSQGHATAKDIWISAGGDWAAAIHSGFYKRMVDMILTAQVSGLIGLTVLLTVIILQGNLFLGIGVLGLLFLLVSIII